MKAYPDVPGMLSLIHKIGTGEFVMVCVSELGLFAFLLIAFPHKNAQVMSPLSQDKIIHMDSVDTGLTPV